MGLMYGWKTNGQQSRATSSLLIPGIGMFIVKQLGTIFLDGLINEWRGNKFMKLERVDLKP
jgi:hypothetical protein